MSRPARAVPPRFLADAMLGGLARWLRILGYDTVWEPAIDDAELVRRGVAEGRWVLTRDRRLAEAGRADHVLLLRADAPLDQLREVAAVVPLAREGLFTRCSRCNRRLREVPSAADSPAAPVRSCPQCGRYYWRGSHTARMERTLDAVLGASGD